MVFDFDDERLEVNHQKFDDLSITYGSIDVTRMPVWPTSDGFRLRWRSDAPALLAARHGQRLEAVELLEWAGGDLADGAVALGLRFASGWLTIYNAMDENGIEDGGPPCGTADTDWGEPATARLDQAVSGRSGWQAAVVSGSRTGTAEIHRLLIEGPARLGLAVDCPSTRWQIRGDPLTGLEPASSRSLAGCSTTELQRISTGLAGWARTSVHPDQSRALYPRADDGR